MKKGFTLVELMVVIAIIAILTAISVPMFSRFKQRSMVGNVIKSAMGNTSALQSWWDEAESFNNVAVAVVPNGALLTGVDEFGNTVALGSSLTSMSDLTWAIDQTSNSLLVLRWNYLSTRCPNIECGGRYCISCTSDGCYTEVKLNTPTNSLGLNRKQRSSVDVCP